MVRFRTLHERKTNTVKLVYGLLTDNRKVKKTLSSEILKYFMQIGVSKSMDKRSLGRDMKESDKGQK